MIHPEPTHRMLIGGRLVGAEGGLLSVLNPATEEIVGHVPDAGDAQLDAAVSAARRAFVTWRATPVDERRAVLAACASTVREHTGELAVLLTTEQGKPLADARIEITTFADWLDAHAAMEYPDDEITETGTHRVRVRRVPLGVVAGIVPWNYPVVLAAKKIGPALLAGNTIVVKPSPYTPLTTLRVGELLADVVPAGVVNIISGGDSLGPRLTGHPGIRKIAFVGSSATGRKVMASAARNLSRVTLELGGNDAAIVLPDVDVDEVARRVFWTCFVNSGQLCIAAKRVYVHEDVYDAFAERFAELARSVKVGNGMEDGVQLGPLQNRAQYEKVVGLIKATIGSGARLLVEGAIPDGPGYFVHPTVVDDPADDAAIVTQEPFGPVVPLLRFRDVDDVVRRANDSEYGLAGTVWSRDIAAAEELAARIEVGTVWINQEAIPTPDLPFGGHKASGIGVENGLEGVLEHTDIQVLSIRKA
ncbi:Aldehyde dehydrogenase [Streptomyces graminofaciens]|uniref:Aldehyde dehydrogenase n=1 Tax=Streptomyces graminofaciens TaxID=68212 RepID=A0ABM7F7M4_9ACTN|nr:aldehyde dehydrogenase family protein [Streptomyces graminofaciens]BBC31928.1 Aldehyde dehydrogenase [Streptomyces graminofaciens]